MTHRSWKQTIGGFAAVATLTLTLGATAFAAAPAGAATSKAVSTATIPGIGVVTLGIGGGPLIVALIAGKLRRTGPLLWVMPLPANIVLRNFGLALFLATVGINAGQPFLRTVSDSGLSMLAIGAASIGQLPT